MKRCVLNLLTVLSLVVCVVLAALWVRSYAVARQGTWASQRIGNNHYRYDCVNLRISRGRLMLSQWRMDFDLSDAPPGEDGAGVPDARGAGLPLGFSWRGRERPTDLARLAGSPWRRHVAGLAWASAQMSSPVGGALSTWDLLLPAWLLAAIMAVPPLLVSRRFVVRRARGLPDGHCLKCGYDLRATPGRCPECGTVAPSPSR